MLFAGSRSRMPLMKRLDSLRAELLGDLDGLVDGDLGRDVGLPQELVARARRRMLRSTTAIRSRSQCSAYCGDQLVDLAPGAAWCRARAPRRSSRASGSTGCRAQNSSSCGAGSPSPVHVELVEELERDLPGLSRRLVPLRRRPPSDASAWRARTRPSRAPPRAASSPRLPTAPPARSHACSSVSAVITPKRRRARPCRAPTSLDARPPPARPRTRSAGVAPLITQPTQTIAGEAPGRAPGARAACGSSNEPGTQCTSTDRVRARRARRAPRTAPSTQALADLLVEAGGHDGEARRRGPRPRGAGGATRGATGHGQSGSEVKQVAQLVPLGLEVVAVRVGWPAPRGARRSTTWRP